MNMLSSMQLMSFPIVFQAIPIAMANLRNMHNICPPEVIKFLLDLFKYNDNSKNKVRVGILHS